MRFLNFKLLIIISLIAFACNKKTNQDAGSQTIDAKNASVEMDASDKVEAQIVTQKELAKNLVKQWNQAHSLNKISELSNLYANDLTYYGSKLTKEKCITDKQKFLTKNKDFIQTIEGEINVVGENDKFQCFFSKQVTMKNTTKIYPSYLYIEKMNDEYRITTEGDEITDANLKKRSEKPVLKEGEVQGDFNGDGKKETAHLVKPKIIADGFDCEGECECKLVFSDASIPPLMIPYCIGGEPVNEGDLNDDGIDEIGLLPDWFTSCWHSYNVYSFKNNAWYNPVAGITTHCNQWEEGVDAIEKDKSRKGRVIIRYSKMDMESGDIKVISKSIKIQ